MSKIKNYFHDEIEAQALERHEQSEPDIEQAELNEAMHTGDYTKQGWYYDPRYQG